MKPDAPGLLVDTRRVGWEDIRAYAKRHGADIIHVDGLEPPVQWVGYGMCPKCAERLAEEAGDSADVRGLDIAIP